MSRSQNEHARQHRERRLGRLPREVCPPRPAERAALAAELPEVVIKSRVAPVNKYENYDPYDLPAYWPDDYEDDYYRPDYTDPDPNPTEPAWRDLWVDGCANDELGRDVREEHDEFIDSYDPYDDDYINELHNPLLDHESPASSIDEVAAEREREKHKHSARRKRAFGRRVA